MVNSLKSTGVLIFTFFISAARLILFKFLNRVMEEDLAPIIIFATNTGITEITGTDIKAPHGMPVDLLDRLLIINTQKYNNKQIKKIIQERCRVEDMELTKEGLELLTKLGEESSLRYAIQLLAPSEKISTTDKITKEDVEQAAGLFADVNTSVNYLEEMSEEMLD